jgi:hypothetical protein
MMIKSILLTSLLALMSEPCLGGSKNEVVYIPGRGCGGSSEIKYRTFEKMPEDLSELTCTFVTIKPRTNHGNM